MRRCVSCGRTMKDDEDFCKSCGNGTSFDSSEKYEENRNKYYGRRFEDPKPISNIAENNAHLYNTPDIKINWRGCGMGCLAFIGLIILLILWSCGVFTPKKTYNGDGYKLSYNKDWKEDTMSDGSKALKYDGEKSYLIPLDADDLSNYVSCDFGKKDCKEELYETIYNNLDVDDIYLEKNKSFSNLKDDIYYATYTYGPSKKNITGNYFVVVSKDSEYVITFMSSTSSKKVNNFNKKVISLLDTIEFTK